MKYFAISADEDTLLGLRLSGIEGVVAGSKREIETQIAAVRADESVAILLITQPCYALCSEMIDEIKLSAQRPLVSVIPSADGGERDPDLISRLIREAIGIKL